MEGVHAMTAVGARGLLGHACDIADMSGCTLAIDYASVPVLRGAHQAVAAGYAPETAHGNLHEVEDRCAIAKGIREKDRILLCDPQVNGGLLLTVHPGQVHAVLEACHHHGQEGAIIGTVEPMRDDETACVLRAPADQPL